MTNQAPDVGPALSALIEHWRAKADEKLNTGGGRFKHSERTIATLRACADELEAALSGSVGGLTIHHESRSPDGDGQGAGLGASVGDSMDREASNLPPQQGHVHARDGNRNAGATPALIDERLAGSEPADSHSPTGSVGGLNAAPPWQEIETHDGGTMPVLVAEGDYVVEAAYSADHDVWWEINSCDDGSPGSDRRVHPTHFMPLPASPVCAAEKKALEEKTI